MKRLSFILSWYLTALTTLVFAIVLLFNLTWTRQIKTPDPSIYQIYKALPTSAALSEQDININKVDGRSNIIAAFFQGRKSPLVSSADVFVSVADKYGLDYRLLPAISMQESNGGKILPLNSYNPFGYGIYGGKVMRFNSFDEAIERVGKGLKEDYINQGLITPEQIMAKYTPPSLAKGGAWAIGVNAFMEQLR